MYICGDDSTMMHMLMSMCVSVSAHARSPITVMIGSRYLKLRTISQPIPRGAHLSNEFHTFGGQEAAYLSLHEDARGPIATQRAECHT